MSGRPAGRRRAALVLGAGGLAAAALVWAALAVHARLDDSGALAAARLAGAASDAVLEEWQRWRERPDPPGLSGPVGLEFRWRPAEALPAPEAPVHSANDASEAPSPLSVSATLLAEAERRELALGDLASALELAREAQARAPEAAAERARAQLRTLQLAGRLGLTEVARESWAALRGTVRPMDFEDGDREDGIPVVLLGWLALPPELQEQTPTADLVDPGTWSRLLEERDQLLFVDGEPIAHFRLAPELAALARRLALPLPDASARAARRLAARLGAWPAVEPDGRWHVLEVAQRAFLARVEDGAAQGLFVDPEALARGLRAAALPQGFALDFRGTDGALGEALRPATTLPGTPLAFTLRHRDPAQLARTEVAGLSTLRAALLALAAACLAGGVLTARLLARERRLAELKSAFVAGVSHDLRTPLASILLLAENLEHGRVGPEQHARYHAAIRAQAERLRRLVDDVLDFSRLERGQETRLALEEVELAPFVDELAEEARARAAELGRSFALRATTLPARATLDAVALRRATLNLVENALRHGAGEVVLSAGVDDGRLRLAVRDHGPGLARADAERVFRPFESLSPGHAGRNGQARPAGVGLGLAIVRAVARAHGGEASSVTPGVGTGAEFVIEVPLEADPA